MADEVPAGVWTMPKFPMYWKWVHPNPEADMVFLVMMEGPFRARYWNRKTQDWDPPDLDDDVDFAIDHGDAVLGVVFEQITTEEAMELIKTKLGPYPPKATG